MQWKVHGHEPVYESSWVNVELADVELPDGQRLEHHVLRMPRQSVVVAVVDESQRVLMLWRHRFITDRWGWELPAGWVEPGEDPAEAGRREVLEETGWCPNPLIPMYSFSSDHGISDSRFHLYRADSATYAGPPADPSESSRIEWLPLSAVRALVEQRQIDDGASLTALLFLLAFGDLGLSSQPHTWSELQIEDKAEDDPAGCGACEGLEPQPPNP